MYKKKINNDNNNTKKKSKIKNAGKNKIQLNKKKNVFFLI